MRTRSALVTAVILAAALAGCGGTDHQQGTAERASDAKAPGQKASKAPKAEKQPDTELAVGDTFAYKDGVKVTVQSIARLTAFGEYDSGPEANQTGYRVTWTLKNGTKKPLDTDLWSESEQGATNGGEVTMLSVEKGSRTMTGRIAPGQSATFTSESALEKSSGNKIVITMTRMDDTADLLAEDPHWTGTIK